MDFKSQVIGKILTISLISMMGAITVSCKHASSGERQETTDTIKLPETEKDKTYVKKDSVNDSIKTNELKQKR